MRPLVFTTQSDADHPLLDEPGILPRADMMGVVDPARKDEVVERAAPTFKPSQNAAASGLKKLELYGPAGLLLNDDRSRTNPAPTDKVTDLDFDDITST
jgi:hypothetical protein